MELNSLLEEIDFNKSKIDNRRPLTPTELKQLDQYFKIGMTYTSNALEGNSLTITETKVLLEDGITVGGKPIKDTYEATGHAKAYDFMLSIARAERLNVTEEVIKRLHFLFYNGLDDEEAGQYRQEQVYITGTDYIPPTSDEVPTRMKEFVNQINKKQNELHPVSLAAFAHKHLAYIHPFIDGNGRTARLLMNLILINKGYCLISIPPILRNEYMAALVAGQREKNSSDITFFTFIVENELEAQKDYSRMLGISLKKEKE